uniref:E3 ubiquitin-protein ligase Sina-like RING finger domain-containing protein n=1 Tax=Photinus pyralis TaxID=7054 RepID=A0A1Y1MGY7_PHOPY
MEKYRSAECPICFHVFPGKIFMCISGHSLCESCWEITIRCAICNEYMTSMRNFTVEALIKEFKENLYSSASKIQKTASKARVKAKEPICPASPSCKSFQSDKHDPIRHMETFHCHDLIKSMYRSGIKSSTVSRSFSSCTSILTTPS